MSNQEKSHPGAPSIANTLFSSLIVIILAFVYIFSRIGLEEDHSYFVYFFSGLSLLLLNLPYNLRSWLYIKRKEPSDPWFFNELLITFYLLLILVLLSYCGIPAMGFVVATSGVALFAATLFHSFKTIHRTYIFGLSVICIFSFWIAAVCWSGHYLSPLFVESIELSTLNESSLDPIFHIAIAQIIKNYGAVSTGLHLLTQVKYHILSHFIMARISDLSDIHMVYAYNIGFVIIFPALFVKFILTATDSLRSFFKVRETNSSLVILVIILGISSILPVPLHNRLAERVMIGNNFQFISESYLISILFVLTVLSTIVQTPIHGRTFKYALFIFLPVSVALCTISKISTGFVLASMLGYIFVRMKGYKGANTIMAAVVICSSFVLAALSVFARDSTNGSFEWMHFFNNYVETRAITFILLFFLWPLLFCLFILSLRYMANRRNNVDLPLSKLFISAEIIIVASIVGVIPPMTVEMAGGSGVFFIEVQRWIALVMFASILPLVISFFNIQALAVKLLKLVMLLIILINTLYYSARALKHNLLVRTYYVMPERTDQISKMNFNMESLLYTLNTIRDPNLIDSFDIKVKERSIYKALNNLMKLSSEADDEKVIYITDYSIFATQLPCYHYFYFIPAFSGFAAFQGIPEWCIAEGYFLETRNEWAAYNEKTFCDSLTQNSFSTLYKYDLQTDTCEKIQCSKIR